MKSADTVEFEEDLKLGLRNMWYPICRSEAVKSEPAGLRRLGEDIVAWRDSVGKIFVHDDRCLHRGAKLSLGKVVNNTLRCGYHGWCYDSSGQCVTIPTSKAAESRLAPRLRLPVFECQERAGLERLAEIRAGTLGQAARLHAGLVVAGDDDDWEPQAGADDLPLQIETAGAGHLQVEHQAVGRDRLRQPGKKVLCGCKSVGLEIGRAQQALQRLAYRFVVVDDRDPVAGCPHGTTSIPDWRRRRYWT